MTGRTLFAKMKWIIDICVVFSKVIPKPIFNFLWFILDGSESKVSLFIRYLYLRKYIKRCGENIYIGKYVTLKNIENLSLGNNISIHSYCYLDSYGDIEIGDNTSIANHSSIISFDHTYVNKIIPIKYNPVEKGKVVIENDVWVGSGCRILPNVKIASRCILAAGAVVNKNIQKNTLVGGVPAKFIKNI